MEHCHQWLCWKQRDELLLWSDAWFMAYAASFGDGTPSSSVTLEAT